MTHPTTPDRGVAMIAVLWIVAALSVLVLGMTDTVRQQIRVAATLQQEVAGQAAGEAAMVIALQALQTRSELVRASVDVQVSFGGTETSVEVMPLDGLISLNGADVPLFASLLQSAGGLGAASAQALAQVLVDWRNQRPAIDPTVQGGANVGARRFEAVEDLLLVPGVDYPLYARLRPLITAEAVGAGRVNALAAPAGVLAALAEGNKGVADRVIAQRRANPSGVDTSGLNAALIGSGGTDLYRLSVKVPLDTGRILLLIRDVALGSRYSRTAPWRTLRTDRQILVPGA